jgi:hypothetical protein
MQDSTEAIFSEDMCVSGAQHDVLAYLDYGFTFSIVPISGFYTLPKGTNHHDADDKEQ